MSDQENTPIKIVFMLPKRTYVSGDVPLGVCSLIAYLKQQYKHIQITLLDGNVLGKDIRAFRRRLEADRFDVAGIFVDTLSFNLAAPLICLARTCAKIVVVGGPHATAMPESFFEHPDLDGIIPGEGEYKLKAFIDAARDTGPLPAIPGVFVRRNGRFAFTPDDNRKVDLETLPFPDRSCIDLPFYFKRLNYFDLFGLPITGTTVMASRGCYFQCTYCQPFLDKHFSPGIRYRSPENVLKELHYLAKEYGVNAVFFHDDNLIADKKWIFSFCDLIQRSGLTMIWGCNSRVDNFTAEVAEAMFKAGLRKVHFGIESGSQRILHEVYKKGTRLEQVRSAIKIAHDQEIATLGFFMIGAPTETREEMSATISLARELELDEATFSIFTPIPGAHLWYQLQDTLRQQNISFDDLNYYSHAAIDLGDGMSRAQIRRKQLYAFWAFYANAKRFRYMLGHFKSRTGLRRLSAKIGRVLGLS